MGPLGLAFAHLGDDADIMGPTVKVLLWSPRLDVEME